MSLLRIERAGNVRLVKLDTGPRNVLRLEAIEALKEALAEDSEAPVVVLSGRRDAFCAGLANDVLARGGYEREELQAAMGELLLQAVRGPTRIVAACEGHAVAGGAMLLLVADVRIGAHGPYKVGFTEPRLGMPLPEIPTLLARERLERRRLHEVTVLGRTLTPEEALAAGFLDTLVRPSQLHFTALQRAHGIATLSTEAYQGTVASLWQPTLERLQQPVADQVARRDKAR